MRRRTKPIACRQSAGQDVPLDFGGMASNRGKKRGQASLFVTGLVRRDVLNDEACPLYFPLYFPPLYFPLTLAWRIKPPMEMRSGTIRTDD